MPNEMASFDVKKILLVDFHGQTVRNEEYFSKMCFLCVLYNRIKKINQ